MPTSNQARPEVPFAEMKVGRTYECVRTIRQSILHPLGSLITITSALDDDGDIIFYNAALERTDNINVSDSSSYGFAEVHDIMAGTPYEHARAESEMEEAARITSQDRNEAYGAPTEHHTRTAALWSGYLGVPITAVDVCYMMTQLKMSREKHKPARDNRVDMHGYIDNARVILEASNA